MAGPADNWRAAAAEFDARYQAIAKDQWEASTPCSEWNVHQLVAHAV
ncbi:MAG: maleylpyruvate isomerase N-terminal domain-containing protein, partial [Acidimicrobiales bacterium]